MNNANDNGKHSPNGRIPTSQRDFSKPIKHKRHSSASILSVITSLDNKIKCLIPLVITLVTMFWLFTGSHNSNEKMIAESISEEITLPVEQPDSEDQAALESDNPETADLTPDNPEADQNTESLANKINGHVDNDSDIITQTIKVKKNDTLSTIFSDLKIPKEDLAKIINNSKVYAHLKKIIAGQELEISVEKTTNQLIEISFFLDKLTLFKVMKDPDHPQELLGKVEKLNLTEQMNFAKLKIKSSLFEDAQKQNLPLDLIFQIIDIFTWDIDFAQDLRTHDTVDILYKEYYLNGSFYTHGPVLAVNFHNHGKTYSAVRYENQYGAYYYTPEGLSLRKAFIRTPVKFTRISSKFNLNRKHPLLHKIRAHRGVDYAAPVGTPIKAAGDGIVIEYARKGGYGKAAIIQHGTKYTTLYGHMSQYNPKLKVGSAVKQGDIIGYVGQTGLASGPHLHFEFRVDGIHQNPLTVQLPKALPINNKDKAKFLEHSHKLAAAMQKHIDYNNFNNNNLLAKNQRFE